MPSNTKTALLDSAEQAVRTRGFDGFSYADLASDVGIRKASIHHHFPSKANLSVELMHRYLERFEKMRTDFQGTLKSGGAQLMAIIKTYRAGMDNGKRLCLCVSFTTSRESLPPEVGQLIHDFRKVMIEALETAFQAGRSDGSISGVTDPAMDAAATLSLLEGAQLAARTEENSDFFDTAVYLLKQRITH
jgi:TetR/AcrR family transcriptional repressor of nem operon